MTDLTVVHDENSPHFGVVVDGCRYRGLLVRVGGDLLLRVEGPMTHRRPHRRTYSFNRAEWFGASLMNSCFWMAADRLLAEARMACGEKVAS